MEEWLTIEQERDEVILKKCSKDAVGEIIIPDGVTSIGDCAFSDSSSLKYVTILSSVTSSGLRKRLSVFN